MKLALLMGVIVVFTASCLTSAYESKPGIPKNNQ
ncbi:hypothetical protein J2Z81_002739 [Virgibacillus campisalis]|uniref:Lipoprotein n=1 Tax=Virgibacillus alimentarius TaxID=698769 RepID=A0ABS4SCK6_9BACI|nr:hypothetical protein [Virgibacillus alimentarius]